MTRTRTARVDPLRLTLVTAAFLVSLAGVFGVLLFPPAWKDDYGYNQLVFLIAVSALHGILGFGLILPVYFGRFSTAFAILIIASPVVHLFGGEIGYCITTTAIGIATTVEVTRVVYTLTRRRKV